MSTPVSTPGRSDQSVELYECGRALRLGLTTEAPIHFLNECLESQRDFRNGRLWRIVDLRHQMDVELALDFRSQHLHLRPQ